MTINFENIAYLQSGNSRQKLAWEVLTRNRVMTKLRAFDPILVGTIPINIDIENSDLDIICCFTNPVDFRNSLIENFGNAVDFTVQEQKKEEGSSVVVANFWLDGFEIEIFGQNIPVRQQNAYRHMLIEFNLLNEKGEEFRHKIIELKKKGYKTEPAFAILLGLKGDPYAELLNFE